MIPPSAIETAARALYERDHGPYWQEIEADRDIHHIEAEDTVRLILDAAAYDELVAEVEHLRGNALFIDAVFAERDQARRERDEAKAFANEKHLEARAYLEGEIEKAEARCADLEKALRGMIAVTELPGTRADLEMHTERAKSAARAALQPTVETTREAIERFDGPYKPLLVAGSAGTLLYNIVEAKSGRIVDDTLWFEHQVIRQCKLLALQPTDEEKP